MQTESKDQPGGVEDDRILCAECGEPMKAPRYLRPGAYRPHYCRKCRKNLGLVTPRTKNDPGLMVWKLDERRPLIPETPRIPEPARTPEDEIDRARWNGTLALNAYRLLDKLNLKSFFVAETLAEVEIAAKTKAKLAPMPHREPCPTCGGAQHAEGLCQPAQAYAHQDQINSAATPLRRGWRAPTRVRSGHGTGQQWPDDIAHRRHERMMVKIAETVQERTRARKARRETDERAEAWAATQRPAGVSDQDWEALRIRTVERQPSGRQMSYRAIAARLGLASRQAAELAVRRAQKARSMKSAS